MAELSAEDFSLLGSALLDIQRAAQPRSDLGGSFGSPDYLGTKPVTTFLGRVVRPGEGLSEILARFPSEVPDAEGMGGLGAILAGAPGVARRVGGKVFREAASELRPAGGFRKSFGPMGERIQQRAAAEGLPDIKYVTDPNISMVTPIDKQIAVIIKQNGMPVFGGIGPRQHPPGVIGQRAFYDPATGILRPDYVADRSIANELRAISGQGGLLAGRAGELGY